MSDFIQECKDWLEPLGYGLHSHGAERNSCLFVYYKDLDIPKPSISCHNSYGSKSCSLSFDGLKFFLSIRSGEIGFKHPDIEDYIGIMTHYAELCENNPPF